MRVSTHESTHVPSMALCPSSIPLSSGTSCTQVVSLPATSVWCVCCMENEDVVVGSRYGYKITTACVHAEFRVTLFNGKRRLCPCMIRPAQLSCLGGSAGRASAQYARCHGFKSRLRQPFFLWKKKELSSGVVAFLCLVFMTD